MNIPGLFQLCVSIAAISLLASNAVWADEEFIGRIEARPAANPGIWTISGQQIEVTEKTDIDPDQGPLVVGACVEVEHDEGVASEIETIAPKKCDDHG
ncbi:hypothetical protein SAMN05192560_1135 [Methylobacillus rhizosphaerae]|uniref:DUF5666 domain-containing protein n=1 Tax=Methylobacillus rhizosphaerae TaxID=551994 RepID=A0A238Z8E5_9PROT|nr:DUF5666 domain-containing protein [Methylobacillus rhizosphaerae]SNR79765.1 hypothetical protein SAMN05192560_1135 [Methylobacillus rhizosphaerae]